MENNSYAHEIIASCYAENKALFPASMSEGYCLNGKTRVSKKTNLQMRKIKTGNQIYQLHPSYILPYQKGEVEQASKGLFLIKFGVPFWALAEIFGHSSTWWYRLYLSLGSNAIVNTSVFLIWQEIKYGIIIKQNQRESLLNKLKDLESGQLE